MDIVENFSIVKKSVPDSVTLIAVSKTKPLEDIQVLYEEGHRMFGENKVQELLGKYETLPKDIEWHYIGHLQSNKVKYIAPFVALIHGVDSFKLLKTINKEGIKNNKEINCLIQFHVAEESTKFGLDLDEAKEILNSEEYKSLKNIRVCGVMGMATYTDDLEQVRGEFSRLKSYFSEIKELFFANQNSFSEISMGMSGDYKLAIEEGSTMVRVGSIIFGERNYSK